MHLARRAFRCRIRARGLLGAGALLLAVSGCSGEGDTDAGTARVAGLPEDVGGIVVRDAGRGPTWVYGAMPVCLQAPGEVRLVELRPALVNGATIVSSGVRLPEPGVEGIATLPGPLPSTYQQLGDLTLKAVCVDGEPGPERAVEVRAGFSAVDGVELVYTDDGKRETALYNLDFVMCQGADTGRDDPKLKACRTTPQ